MMGDVERFISAEGRLIERRAVVLAISIIKILLFDAFQV